MKNTSSQSVTVTNAAFLCSITCPFTGFFELSAGQATLVENPGNSRLLASPTGLLLNVAGRQAVDANDVQFNFRIRNVSESDSTWGTELPVIPATGFRTSAIELLNVPVSAGFRSTVRVYAIEGPTPIAATARVYDFSTGRQLLEKSFTLDRPPDQSDPAYYPAYAQLDGLVDGVASGRVIVEITPAQTGQPLWAFVSITNNDTQQITLVTPQ